MQIICIIKNLLGENQYMMWETFYDLLLDALIDSLKLLPFLFGAYLLIEWVEHRGQRRLAHSLKKAGRFGPLVGALAGCVPQCGFSVVAANFYSGGIITMGTLVAVFLSTSDEALPILLAHPDQLWAVGALLGGKVAIGLFAGFLIDLLFRRSVAEEQQLHHQEMCSHCHCEQGIFRSALRHSLQIFLFLFGVSLALGAAIHFVGQERLSSLLMAGQHLAAVDCWNHRADSKLRLFRADYRAVPVRGFEFRRRHGRAVHRNRHGRFSALSHPPQLERKPAGAGPDYAVRGAGGRIDWFIGISPVTLCFLLYAAVFSCFYRKGKHRNEK